MADRKIMNEEDLMVDFAEMTSFDFNSLNYKEIRQLQKITDNDYTKQPFAFKYGKFDLADLFHSFITAKE